MAELVGLAASCVGLAGLGCQILKSVYKLQQLLTAIQDAPQEMQNILEEIALVTKVLIQCSEGPQHLVISLNQPQVRNQALLQCKIACKHLCDIVSEIEERMKGTKCRSRWYRVQAVLKEKKIADLVTRLERTKLTLALAQLMYLQSLEPERLDRKESTQMLPAVQKQKLLSSSTIIRQRGNDDLHTSYNETTFQLGIGVLVVGHKRSAGGVHHSSMEEARVQFRFASWFLRWGINMIMRREFGNSKITIEPYRLIHPNSAIFQACALGDNQAVARLIGEGKASPFDITGNGITPLLVAAAWLHPNICKQLLEYGADGSVSLQCYNISWTPLGLAVERAGYYRRFMFPELEKYSLDPQEGLSRMHETMSVLTDYDSVEVHQGYKPWKSGCWNGSNSALHMFRGTCEDFLWLTQRQNALMTAQVSDDYIASVVLQQTQMFPNYSFPAAFSQVSNMKSLAKYINSDRSTLLHYLLNSNFGTEPGIWKNGLDIFNYVKILIEHGADPTARNGQGNTPLMEVARNSRRIFWSNGLCWTVEAVAELYSRFLMRWIETLESCHVDIEKYRFDEIESGAENFSATCRYYEDSDDAPTSAKFWFVRLVFERGDAHQALRIKFQFQSKDKNMIMPGAWPDQFVDC